MRMTAEPFEQVEHEHWGRRRTTRGCLPQPLGSAITIGERTGRGGQALGREASPATDDRPSLLSPTGWNDPYVKVLIAGTALAGLIVAVRAQRTVLYDDAAIFFRYAERIANGQGWTYNDLDHTNGASSPLYTMLLAGARRAGADVETTARAIGAASYAVAIALIAYLGARISGVIAGLLAGGMLLLAIDFQTQAMSGMEVALAVALGLGVVVAALNERDVLAGVLLGLAMVNKLDAATLAVALGLAYLIARRRPPWLLALTSAAVLAPWLLYSMITFGSPVPFSATQKATGVVANPATAFSRTWIVEQFHTDGFVYLAIAALPSLGIAWAIRRRRPGPALALGASGLWGLITFVLYSTIDLGDIYSWYATAIYAPGALGAACSLCFGCVLLRGRGGTRAIAIPALVAATLLLTLPQHLSPRGTSLGTVRHGRNVDEYEAFDIARLDAARYVRDHAQPRDVVSTCYGWVAFEASLATIDETCPLATRERVRDPAWLVIFGYPGQTSPDLRGYAYQQPVIVFTSVSTVGQGARVDVVRLQPGIRSRLVDLLCARRVACDQASRGEVAEHPDQEATSDPSLAGQLARDLEAPVAGGSASDLSVRREDATCLAHAYTDAVGDEALAARGVTSDAVRAGHFTGRPLADYAPLSPAEITAFVNRWLPCGELTEFLLDVARAYGITGPRADCLVRFSLASESFHRMVEDIVAGRIPGELGPDAAAVAACQDR